ncbi:MAG: hypothetical protein OXG55_07155, partial [bacterium]|nr:hypothetical protein [bacterium]
TLPIAAGAASGTADFTLTPTDDNTATNDETVTLSATQAGATVNSGTLAVTDDDAEVSLALSATSGDVTEGASGAAGHKDVTVALGRVLAGSETVTVPLTVQGMTVGADYTFALQPAAQTGVTLVTSGGGNSAQNPAVRLAAGATSATLRFTPVDNDVRSQPAVVIAYGTSSRLPSGTGVTLGTPAGSPVVFAVADDETGAIEVPSSWVLRPAGAGAGEQFRLLFVTSAARNASSQVIADYDGFVRAAAAQGHAAVVPYGGLFRVLGSTATADASAHAGFAGSDAVEVYWLGDTAAADRVAASYPGLRGEWQNQAAPHDESGATASVNTAGYFTGSTSAGAKSANPLGSASVSLGYCADSGTGRAPLGSTQTAASTQTRPFYGLSPVFTVAGEAGFAQAAQSVDEDAGTVNVTVDISPAAGAPVTVGYTLSGTAARGSDYTIAGVTGSSGTVTVPMGATSVNIPVAVIDDSDREGAETVVLTLTDGDGYTLGPTAGHTLTINANDQPGTATFAQSAKSVNEDAGTVGVTVDLSQAQATAFDVSYTVSGTATLGTDYTIAGVTSNSGTIRVPAQATSVTIPVAVTDDAAEEAAETVVLTLAASADSPARYSLDEAHKVYTLTIAASDRPCTGPKVGIADQFHSVAEDGGSVRLSLSVIRAATNPCTDAFSVGYTIAGGSVGAGGHPAATAGEDLAASGSVTVPERALWAHFDVAITDDHVAEGVESAVLTLEASDAYTLMNHTQAQIAIADDDARG